MNNHNKTLTTVTRILIGLSLAPILFAGCASTPKRVDNTTEHRVETAGITIRDFQEAATDMVNSLNGSIINTGQLRAPAGKQAMLEVSRIVNNTTLHIDTDLLTFPITTALSQTGKVETKTTDQKARENSDAGRFFRDEKGMSRLPDYTLSGKIIEHRDQSGNTRESSYVFQMFLNSTTSDAVSVWQEQKIITKQSKRRPVGF